MAAKIVGLNLDKDDLYQEIDLADFGLSDVSQSTAESIGQDLIDIMIDRTTDDNKSVDGGKLASYKKSYKESEDFEQFGKTNEVNMTLSGDMVGSVDLTEVIDSRIKIGFEDKLQSNKAYGHMTGMEGHPFLDGKVKKRRWFGVTESDIEDVVSGYKKDKKDVKDTKVGDILKALGAVSREKTESAFDFLLGDFLGR